MDIHDTPRLQARRSSYWSFCFQRRSARPLLDESSSSFVAFRGVATGEYDATALDF
jgi:hypothetical protein